MTQEQKRIAIAKACGWKGISLARLYGYAPWRAIPYEIRIANYPVSDFESIPLDPLPAYFSDLNACHDIEKSLCSIDQWIRYEKFLAELGTKFIWHATATQRAEAFGLTLNLWK